LVEGWWSSWSVPVRVLSGALGNGLFPGLFDVCGNIDSMPAPDLTAAERRRRDSEINAAARAETLRADGARSLGENLEQADALIRVAFELARGCAAAEA
jgi:hypothetical protein